MKIRALAILSVACAAMSFTPVWAGPVGVQRNLSPDQKAVAVWQLQAKQEQVGRQLPEPPKGPALVRDIAKRAQLEELINRMQSGRHGSPDEIARALQP